MKENLLECYFVVAEFGNKYEVIGCHEEEQDALEHKKKFEKSMYLLDVSKCIIVKGSEIINLDEIGFENNVKFNQ